MNETTLSKQKIADNIIRKDVNENVELRRGKKTVQDLLLYAICNSCLLMV